MGKKQLKKVFHNEKGNYGECDYRQRKWSKKIKEEEKLGRLRKLMNREESKKWGTFMYGSVGRKREIEARIKDEV